MSEVTNRNPYAEVYQKIGYYRANSNDVSFHAYLDVKLNEAERGLVAPDALAYDLDVNYQRYLQIAKVINENSGNVQHTGDIPFYTSDLYREENRQAADKKKKRTELEIKIGTGVLSVIGAVFILVALVYFGRYFLSDFYQGIMMYIAGVVIVAVSEIVLEKKMNKLAHIVTGIGFGFLYFATIFSHMYLNMFSFIVSAGILIGIALFNFLFARLRKSQVMEIVTSLGSAVSICTVKGRASLEEFALIAGLMLFVNLLLFIDIYKPGQRISKITRLSVVFVSSLYITVSSYFRGVDFLPLHIFVAVTVLVLLIAYAFNTEDMGFKATALTFIGIIIASSFRSQFEVNTETLIWIGALFIACLIPFLVMAKKKEKWAAYSVFLISIVFFMTSCKDDTLSLLIMLVCLIISKCLLPVEELVYIDAIVTSFALIGAVINYKDMLSYVIVVVAIIGAIMCTKIKLFHEFAVLCSTFFVVGMATKGFYSVPTLMVSVFALILLFNLIPTMQVEGTLAYNIVSMAILGCCVLYAPLQGLKGWENIASLSLCTVVGMAAILTCFRKKFLMDTSARYIIFACFLTYMALLMDVDKLWISISLMAVAFLMIAVGCIANRFEIRIYGLVLSLLVCVKVAFYDFRGEADFQRMIVFLIVGVLAILISFTYLMLEKHEQKEKAMLEEAMKTSMEVSSDISNKEIEETASENVNEVIEETKEVISDTVVEGEENNCEEN